MATHDTQDHALDSAALARTVRAYLANPESIDPAIRAALDDLAQRTQRAGRPTGVQVAERTVDPVDVARAVALAEAIRLYGHLAVRLDPLGTEASSDERLDPATHGLAEADLARLPAVIIRGPLTDGARDARAAIEALRRVYSGRIGYEFGHLPSAKERQWLERTIEREQFAPALNADEGRALLDGLTQIEAFERILHRAFVGQKRFSGEGLDITLPMIDEMVSLAARAGFANVVLGMAHRGRLAARVYLAGQPFSAIWQAFAHPPAEEGGHDPGDVKYHLGGSGRYARIENGPMFHLRPNPSHLEWVNPSVEGFARALQDDRSSAGAPPRSDLGALPIVVHGDAAFPGEGIVSETMNLAELAGYTTGGTLHIIANNQIGFTTDPSCARGTRYASDLAKGFNVPVFHVNADDPEACIAVTRLAFAWRQEFGRDALIDVVGYRRWGHNEGDEPAYTQPEMYRAIGDHPTVRQVWASALEARGILAPGTADQQLAAADAALRAATEAADHDDHAHRSRFTDPADTGVPAATLGALNTALMRRADGFSAMPKLEQQLQRSRGTLEPGRPIDWGHAESLAFASILAEGTPIRLTGQDAERGTFSHRHAALHDTATNATYIPLQNLPQAKASFAIHNSPLSEGAVLGFEYGYSAAAPEALVMWEAQFGDFANVAQVIIDQFISSAGAKWHELNGVVLLLPHGYEGQGPEHSSARVERFLQLFAEDNMQIAICSTAAQYFHLLRLQVTRLQAHDPRPLVIFTPKSLLRSPAAAATLEQLTTGAFQPVLDDPATAGREDNVTRLILCTGKIGLEILASDERKAARHVAVARIERLAPFPFGQLKAVMARYPNLEEVVWAQEEPRNMGAVNFVWPRISTLLPKGMPLHYAGRLDKASPAEGTTDKHAYNQKQIILKAIGE